MIDKHCSLCGAQGHTAPNCPWVKRVDAWLPKAEHTQALRRQSKVASLAEAVVNTFVGLLIAFVAQAFICWAYDIPLSAHQNFVIVSWMTVISVARSYVLRRAWNAEFWKRRNSS